MLMSEILLYYKRPDPTTWVYLSSFLTIGLFFVFHRFWSIRNLDIFLLILLAPGLLMVHEGRRRQLQEIESEVITHRQTETVPATPHSANADSDQGSRLSNTELRNTGLANTGLRELAAAGDLNPSPRSQNAATSSLSSKLGSSGGDVLVALTQAVPTDDPDAATMSEEEASVRAEAAILAQPAVPLATDSPESMLDADAAGSADASTADIEADVDPEASSEIDPEDIRRYGFISLFIVQFMLLIRLLLDPLMVRRPLLDPNLSSGGLTFIGVSLFIFMMANIVASTPRIQIEQGPKLGPGYALMNMLPAIPTRPVTDALAGSTLGDENELNESQSRLATIAKVLAILAHAAIVSGIVLIGNWHFGNMRAGVGCATLYLLMPYTAQMTGRVDHALPAALLLWAVLFYRKPLVAGIFLGLAAGLVYYPFFLLPLWISFYWRRGVWRFTIGVAVMLGLLMMLLSLSGVESLVDHLRTMFGLFKPETKSNILGGIWGLGWNPIWRLPVIVGFVILCSFFAAWPAQKNLGTLIGCSAAVMVGAQFWHGYGGGLYIAWFLPLLLLTIFRPNLQDRIALKVVSDSSNKKRRPAALEVDAA
ncbi:hypothetical protein Rcae01_02903 [Novipirellula caenicola]|uniref:Transmembrane protein n=2 Tax=Novipirellula caenicola TaxID=1536901 RepID=A0ABP9VQL9_9BACT